MKTFVKAMDKTGAAFIYCIKNFSGKSDAKVKEGVFIGTQIRQLLQDSDFDQALFVKEKIVWEAFKLMAAKFLGIAENYTELVSNLTKA